MNKEEIMRLADGYAIAVAQAPHSPRPREKKLAEQRIEKARSALEAALEQEQAEPVAYLSYKPILISTYTISPQRKQLTVERIHHLCSAFHQWSEWDEEKYRQLWVDLVRSVEADHDIKEPKS